MEKQKISLPENAQRELAPGEEYRPILGAEKSFKEVTLYSVAVGILMVVLFSAAAAYLGLRPWERRTAWDRTSLSSPSAAAPARWSLAPSSPCPLSIY